MADAKTVAPDQTAVALRDPRLMWTFVFGGFALMFFACYLIEKGSPAQQGFVYTVFGMSLAMFVTSGVLKVSDAIALIKAIFGKS